MKVLHRLSVFVITAVLSFNSYAFPEIPFCPAGGPPGWMNHFNYKRDQNIWRRYAQYSSPAYLQSEYYRPVYSAPSTPPTYNRPDYYTPTYNYNQNRLWQGALPTTSN